MIVNNTKREKNTVTFDVTLDAAEFESYVNAAYKKAKGKITVPGFRKGHAPRKVVEGMYGKDVFYDDAMNDAAPVAFMFGAGEEKLEVVGQPAVEKFDFNEENALVLSFKTDVWPECELGEYKGLEAPKAAVEVSEDEVMAEVSRLREQGARITPVERESANGDVLNIDFEGFRDGVAFAGGKGEGYDLELGSGSFIPGFEEQLVGMKAGEEKDISVHFPAEYHSKELADQDATFHVKCNEVKEKILPELDDEFAKDNDCDTLEELKNGIRERMLKSRQEVADSAFEEVIVNKAAENMIVDIPQCMIEEALDNKVNEYASYMSAQGMKLEEYLKMTGSSYELFRERYREAAANEVRTEVLLRAVAKAEGIEIAEEEMESEYADLAAKYGMKIENVKRAIPEGDMRNQMIHKKAAALIAAAGVPVAEVNETEEAAGEQAE